MKLRIWTKNLKTDIEVRSGVEVELKEFDITDYESHQKFYDSLSEKPLGVIVVSGYMVEQKLAQKDWSESLQTINVKPEKCGFGLVAEIKAHIKEFSIEQQQTIQQILERPTLQTSLISPSEIFRIHYDTTGSNKPEYDINELAVAFDSSYNYEVNILSYLAPPKDGTDGGDDKYDIYIEDLSGGYYGLTTADKPSGENIFTSHIQIDNSFSRNEGYNTFGIQAARATAAHEFHHAIQMGNYILNFDDTYYHELTSTAMEEVVYDDVDDYYYYISSYFNSTEKSFIKQSGYNLALWNIYLREKFNGNAPNTGDEIIKKSWELMAHPQYNRAAVALAKAMNEFGHSFKQELNSFSTWIYFTNYRTNENKYFEEAINYPLILPTYKNEFTPPQKTIMLKNVQPTSINYLLFTDVSQGLPDTVYSIISNSDVVGTTSNSYVELDYTIGNTSFEGASSIDDYYYSKIEGTALENISEVNIINNKLADKNISRNKIDFAYPQPFNYDDNTNVYIPTHTDVAGIAELNVYSADMNLVYSDKLKILGDENIVVKWKGLNANNNRLASGVYIYVTKADGKIKKGKIVILNK